MCHDDLTLGPSFTQLRTYSNKIERNNLEVIEHRLRHDSKTTATPAR